MEHARSTAKSVVLGVFLATLSWTRLHATTLVMMSDQDLVRGSSVIVVGQVLSIRSTTESTARIETTIDLKVETSIKGLVAHEITFVIPGGTAGSVQRVIFGAPQFARGERVLVFLRERPDGVLAVTGLAMGKYSIVSATIGEVARRQLGGADGSVSVYDKALGRLGPGTAKDIRALDELLDGLRKIVADQPASMAAALPRAALSPADAGRISAAFTFLGPPPARWTEPDRRMPVGFFVVPGGDAALGIDQSMEAVSAAMAAWSAAGSSLRLVDAGAGEPAPFAACDGVSTIQFNDPFNCGGILAMGGYCMDTGATSTLNGITFARITEGDLTTNDGFDACSYWNATNLAETLTHELGHTIGLAHSSENPQEPNPLLKDATMYYMAHRDNRGASLRADDRAGVQALYPERVAQRRYHTARRIAPLHTASRPPTHLR